MLFRFVLVCWFISIVVISSAVINPAIQLPDLSSSNGFAGESAMRVVNGITHVTYRVLNDNWTIGIKYARILPDSTVESYIVDANAGDSFGNGAINLPTLEIDGNSIYIFYTKHDAVQKAVSTDNGVTFTIASLESASDTIPIIKKNDGQWTSFITPFDALSDSCYMSFSDQDTWEWGTQSYYIGTDVITGPVRSNTNIGVKQAGGGNNSGWPTFYGPVFTSGGITSYSGTPPYAQIFRGGYSEQVPVLNPDFETLDWSLHHNGNVIGPNSPMENRILFVTVNGNSYTSMMGRVIITDTDSLSVYGTYPPATGNPLYVNAVPHVDTLWVEGPSGTTTNGINIVNTPLWIRGTFAGTQTWYSPFNIMINNDIMLQGVPAGEEPPVDCENHVALVSDSRILIQYGYKDPVDSLRYHPNCDGEAQGVFIYASLFAVKPDPEGNHFKDGCFTYEYQQPHPSIPTFTLNGITYDNIDLHRRHYPQLSFTDVGRWPMNIDYPYYNPLWPEGYPYMERGTIHLFGTVAQYRKGMAHRNIINGDYPNTGFVWNPAVGFYGGPAGAQVVDPILNIALSGINAPGASGGGVGYLYKDYHYDSRLAFDTFPYNPFGLGIRVKSSSDGEAWTIRHFQSLNEPPAIKTQNTRDGMTALLYNNHLLWQASPTADITEPDINQPAADSLQNLLIKDDGKMLLNLFRNNAAGQDSTRLVEFDPANNSAQLKFALPAYRKFSTMFFRPDGTPCFATLESDGRIRFYQPDADGNMQSVSVWNPFIPGLQFDLFDLEHSSMNINESNTGNIEIIFSLKTTTSPSSDFYVANGTLEFTANHEDILPEPVVTTRLYPNPFKQKLTFNVKTNRTVPADISIYNIKGQKVRTLTTNYLLSKGSQDFTWDGLDSDGNPTASGIYFLKSDIAGKVSLTKLLKIR